MLGPRRGHSERSRSWSVTSRAATCSARSAWCAATAVRSRSSDAPRMRTASSPALRPPPMLTVATGTPAGICTIDSRLSRPPRCSSGRGTPMTGSGVDAATIPGRCAAPPAPAMTTRIPRPAALSAYSSIRRGVRCAETTCASYGTSKSSSTSAAGCIIGQSESLPMTIPTTGSSSCSSTRASCGSVLFGERERRIDHAVGEVAGGGSGAGAHRVEVVAERGDVTELAPRPLPLAVPVDLHVRPVRHQVVHALVEPGAVPAGGAGGAAQHVGHDDDRRRGGGRAEGVVEHRPQVLLELAGARPLDRPVPGVVRPHGQLVDQDAVGGLEELDREQAHDAEGGGDADGQLLR